MIRAVIKRNEDGCILAFKVDGHANYNPSNDIVCAAVSAVVIGTVNAIDALTDSDMPQLIYQSGLFKISFEETTHKSVQHDEKAQLLLNAMIVMLRSIEQIYKDHISVKDRVR